MLRDVYIKCRDRLKSGGIEAPDFEARCILEFVTGYDRTAQLIHCKDELPEEKKQLVNSITEKRSSRYPLQYLLHSWDFMGFPLSVGEGVLIPRDDTEVCVRLCLEYLKDKPNAEAIDLCSGSGAIAIALEKLGRAKTTAVEYSDEAFIFLKKNIKQNNCLINAVKGDIFICHTEFPDNAFDLIVSNPPYIRRSELPTLQADVLFEPKTALDGGEDGLDFYRAIIRDWTPKLKKGGALVFELGEDQAETVGEMMIKHGFENIRTETDFGGCERAIIGFLALSSGR